MSPRQENPSAGNLPASRSSLTSRTFKAGKLKRALSPEQAALGLVLALGALIRCAAAFSGTNIQYPTETFQYLEQGHRLAFGSGVVPFEFDYGIRSWLVPGLAAGVMKISNRFSTNPFLYVYALRSIAAALSLVPVYVAFRMVLPKAGLAWAAITAFFCAVWHHAVIVSPSILPEVLAAYLMFPAVLIAGDRTHDDRHHTIALGVLLGSAFCLRFQMAPALFVIACWHCKLDYCKKWLPFLLSGGAVVGVLAGLLDWVTLGAPFQSIWLNYYLNAVTDVSVSFGQPDLYASYVNDIVPLRAYWMLAVLWLAIIGASRAPLLAATALAVLVSHALVAHREYRFIVFFMLALPILAGFGAYSLSEIVRRRFGRPAALAVSAIAVLLVPASAYLEWSAGRPFHLAGNAGITRAFLVAHDEPRLCGLGVADYFWPATGGYTYLNRDTPIYYSTLLHPSALPRYYEQTNFLHGPRRTRVPLRMHVVAKGQTILQLPGDTIFEHTAAFNYLIARKGRFVAGYSPVGCFENEANSPWPAACLLRRGGGCTEP